MPRISLVIAASQRTAAWRATLTQALAQSLCPAEILIALHRDAAEVDDIRRAADEFDFPVRIVTHAELPSFAEDLNCALPAVRTDFVTVVRCGEQWQPSSLMDLVEAAGAYAWSAALPELSSEPDSLTKIVGSAGRIEALLFPRSLGDRVLPLDSRTDSLTTWDMAIAFALIAGPGGLCHPAIGASTPSPAVPLADLIQVLRKHAPRLRKAVTNYPALVKRVLSTRTTDEASLSRAEAATALPRLNVDNRLGADKVFLISLPRSGSSMLQSVLGAHPDIHTLPEPWIMLNPCSARRPEDASAEYEPALAARALDGFLAHTGGDGLYDDAARALGERLYGAAMRDSGKRLFLDKTPRYFHIIPELRRIYPRAKFVFLRRHPLAVLSSLLQTWFEDDVEAFTNNQNAADCFDGPQRIAQSIDELGGDAICVQYEEFVADPVMQTRALCERLGISYFDGMLNYRHANLPDSEFGDHDNLDRFDRPVDRFAAQWRTRFADAKLAAVGRELITHLGHALMSSMGYDYEQALNLLAGPEAPHVPEAARDLTADELTHRGEQAYAGGKAELAQSLFEQALQQDPTFALAHNNLGVLSAAKGHSSLAVDCFMAALNNNANERDALLNLIESALAADRLAEALPHLKNYLQANPHDEEVGAYAREVVDALSPAVAAAPASGTGEHEPPDAQTPALLRAPVVLIPGELPRITIVTPSYNQGEYLEACLDSILSQNYPNLEYIVMDGGSTDRSVSILKRYAKYLSHWQSAPDDGQYAAIEQGFKRSTGEIMAWLNSDDKYHADALWKVAYAFTTRPQVEWITGLYTFWDSLGTVTGVLDPVYWTQSMQLDPKFMATVQQESTFWRRSLWDKAGARLATELYYAGDWDLWTRFFHHTTLHTLEWTLGGYRYHEGQKVGTDGRAYAAEAEVLRERECTRLAAADLTARAEPPPPIRLDDAALLELRDWRAQSLPSTPYVSTVGKLTKNPKHKRRRSDKSCKIDIVTSLRPDAEHDQRLAVASWMEAGWHVVSVNETQDIDALRQEYPDVRFTATGEVTRFVHTEDKVNLRALLDAARECAGDYVGILKPDVFIDDGRGLGRGLAGYPRRAMIYGDKLVVNSLDVLDGFADGYGFVFFEPGFAQALAPGDLTFSQQWWVHWLLMTAIAKKHPIYKLDATHAYRMRKSKLVQVDELTLGSKTCISSVFAQFFPAEFKTIPSLKLSFDVESQDFESFARSFVGRHAA